MYLERERTEPWKVPHALIANRLLYRVEQLITQQGTVSDGKQQQVKLSWPEDEIVFLPEEDIVLRGDA